MSQILEERGITEVLHFTTNRGLVGILASGALRSRHALPGDKYLEHVLHVNAATRPEASDFFDKSENWLDYVNLSISAINRRYFLVSQRWHVSADIWWSLLSFDAAILAHQGVYFATTNNSYALCRRAAGDAGLSAIFAETIGRKLGWTIRRANRSPNLPTCEQAEALFPTEVATRWLRKVYVRTAEQHDQALGWVREFGLSDVRVVVSEPMFVGHPN